MATTANAESTAPSAAPTGQAEQHRFPLYGGEKWNAIVGTVSPTQASDPDLMRTTHEQIETAAGGYLTQICQHRIQFTKGSPARLAPQARDHITAALDYAEKTGNAPLKDSLETTLKIMDATTSADGWDMRRLSRKGRADPPRALLYHSILSIWIDTLAGTLTTGRTSGGAPGKREANSPAIRFLIAALEPLFTISREAAKKIVENEKRERARARKLIAEVQERQERMAK